LVRAGVVGWAVMVKITPLGLYAVAVVLFVLCTLVYTLPE
jgi:hypothetical protein